MRKMCNVAECVVGGGYLSRLKIKRASGSGSVQLLVIPQDKL